MSSGSNVDGDVGCAAFPLKDDAVISKRFDRLGFDGGAARLGIMGGTFDPIHLGHLACAEMARDACGLDAVLFMVAARPSFKRDQTITDVIDRMALCRHAVANNPFFDVSALEASRPGITYTVDTLRTLRNHYPEQVELYFIIGTDSLATLPSWYEADVIASLARFICVARPGRFDRQDLIAQAEQMGFTIDLVDAPLLDISSSEIRRRVRQEETIRYLVPSQVNAYIVQHGLYEKVPV